MKKFLSNGEEAQGVPNFLFHMSLTKVNPGSCPVFAGFPL